MQFKEQNCKQNELLMKKLQFLLTMLLVAVLSVSFVSCEKEQPEEKKSNSELIIGTWNFLSVEITVKAEGQEVSQKESVAEYGITWTFTKNGEMIIESEGETEISDYKVDGDKLYLDGLAVQISKLTEKELSISEEGAEEVEGIEYQYKTTYNFERAE